MNGLNYIRRRCNITIQELADVLGVTRQMVSAWEHGKKEIPAKRKENLAEFFGIPEDYFEEISEEEKQFLVSKAMFQHELKGKIIYLYRRPKVNEEKQRLDLYFRKDNDLMINEEYKQALKLKKETIEKIEEMMQVDGWDQEAAISVIHRECWFYETMTRLLQKAREQKSARKVPFRYEIKNIMLAMLIGFELESEEIFSEMKCWDDTNPAPAPDREFIERLSALIYQHWKEKFDFYENYEKNMREKKETKERNISQEKRQEENAEKKISQIEKETGKEILEGNYEAIIVSGCDTRW